MRPHPRIRKTIKYGGAALTVLLVAVWVWSVLGEWYAVFRAPNGAGAAIMADRLCLFGRDPDSWTMAGRLTGLEIGGCAAHAWDFDWFSTEAGWMWYVPLWFVTGVLLLPTALAFRLDTLARRRERMNLCKRCGYDRTGLVGGGDAVCPECGTGSGTA